MTEETRKLSPEAQKRIGAIMRGKSPSAMSLKIVLEWATALVETAYFEGEKAGRSAQKAEDNSYGNGTCSGVDLVG